MNGLSNSLKKEYGKLYDSVRAIINQEDPINQIKDGAFEDEYDSEIAAILARMKECRSIPLMQKMVHDVFTQSFDPPVAGPVKRYRKLAERLCKLIGVEEEKHVMKRRGKR